MLPLVERTVFSPYSTLNLAIQPTPLGFVVPFGAHTNVRRDVVSWDWPETEFTVVPSATKTVCFGVWVVETGPGLAFAQSDDTMPGAPASMRERVIWGTCPPNATNLLAQGTIEILRIAPGGVDERGKV